MQTRMLSGTLSFLGVFGLLIWMNMTPPAQIFKRFSMLLGLAFLQGACLGPLINHTINIDPRYATNAPQQITYTQQHCCHRFCGYHNYLCMFLWNVPLCCPPLLPLPCRDPLFRSFPHGNPFICKSLCPLCSCIQLPTLRWTDAFLWIHCFWYASVCNVGHY